MSDEKERFDEAISKILEVPPMDVKSALEQRSMSEQKSVRR